MFSSIWRNGNSSLVDPLALPDANCNEYRVQVSLLLKCSAWLGWARELWTGEDLFIESSGEGLSLRTKLLFYRSLLDEWERIWRQHAGYWHWDKFSLEWWLKRKQTFLTPSKFLLYFRYLVFFEAPPNLKPNVKKFVIPQGSVCPPTGQPSSGENNDPRIPANCQEYAYF